MIHGLYLILLELNVFKMVHCINVLTNKLITFKNTIEIQLMQFLQWDRTIKMDFGRQLVLHMSLDLIQDIMITNGESHKVHNIQQVKVFKTG